MKDHIRKGMVLQVPQYEFRCPTCGHTFDKFYHNMKDAERTTECPKCKVSGAHRLLSSGFRFSFETGHFFEPYVDTDIHPNGDPIKIESQQQFFKECEKHGRGYRKIRDKLR